MDGLDGDARGLCGVRAHPWTWRRPVIVKLPSPSEYATAVEALAAVWAGSGATNSAFA
jgi:hypothetical protein